MRHLLRTRRPARAPSWRPLSEAPLASVVPLWTRSGDPLCMESGTFGLSRDTAWAMSEENVGLVRRIYTAGLIYRDPEGLVDELGTPDIEYVNPPYAVEPGIRRGPAEVARALRRAHELFAAPRYVIKELFDGGDIVV